MNASRYIEQEFLSEDGLMDQVIKTRSLNTISEKLLNLEAITTDEIVLKMINSLKNLIEDCYVIKMYKFQFKLLTRSINKEIETIEEIIEHE